MAFSFRTVELRSAGWRQGALRCRTTGYNFLRALQTTLRATRPQPTYTGERIAGTAVSQDAKWGPITSKALWALVKQLGGERRMLDGIAQEARARQIGPWSMASAVWVLDHIQSPPRIAGIDDVSFDPGTEFPAWAAAPVKPSGWTTIVAFECEPVPAVAPAPTPRPAPAPAPPAAVDPDPMTPQEQAVVASAETAAPVPVATVAPPPAEIVPTGLGGPPAPLQVSSVTGPMLAAVGVGVVALGFIGYKTWGAFRARGELARANPGMQLFEHPFKRHLLFACDSSGCWRFGVYPEHPKSYGWANRRLLTREEMREFADARAAGIASLMQARRAGWPG